MELNDVKLYLRVDGDEDDTLISSLILTAKRYIENGTGITIEMANNSEKIKPIYNLALELLISHWYENREIEGTNKNKLSFSIDSLLLQLEAEYLKMKRVGVI